MPYHSSCMQPTPSIFTLLHAYHQTFTCNPLFDTVAGLKTTNNRLVIVVLLALKLLQRIAAAQLTAAVIPTCLALPTANTNQHEPTNSLVCSPARRTINHASASLANIRRLGFLGILKAAP